MPEKKLEKTKPEAQEVKTETPKEEAPKVVKTQGKKKKTSPECKVYIEASFNNTIVTITDVEGNTLSSSSPGVVGFKGTKKSTAFAATKAAQDAVTKAQKYGVREAKVYIKGPGPGRNAAVKGLDTGGLRITLISDLTSTPHNGCRPKNRPKK